MLEIIKQFVRRMLMGKGKGILQIPPQNKVDAFAKDLLKKFKQNGIPDEAITNPRDVKIIWEQITNREAQILHTNLTDILGPSGLRKTPLPKTSAEVVDLTGKKIDTSKPILGGKNVPESEVQIKSRLEGMNKKTVERIKRRRYEAALKAERKKAAKDPFYLPDIIDPDDFLAEGGIAGLGERTGYFRGALADTKAGKAMSPGTRADYSPGQGHRENVGRPPGGGDPGMTYTAPPAETGKWITKKQYPPSLSHPILREEARKKREEAEFEAMWRGAPPSMGAREKMFRKQRTARLLEEQRIRDFSKKMGEREKLYPYADMSEEQFAQAHPEIYDFMKKDPAFNWETFKKVSFANPGETYQATGARDIGLPLGRTDTKTLDLYMTPFGVTNYEMSSEGPFNKTKIMSDLEKAQVALHEMRHKKILTEPLLTAAQPPSAVEDVEFKQSMPGMIRDYPGPNLEMPMVYRHANPAGSKEEFSSPLGMHEVFTRFMDRQYGPLKTPSGPYFDKIWRDEWQPYADEYEKILTEYDLSPVNLAGGGRAGSGLNYLLGEDDQNVRMPVNQGGRIPFSMGKRAFLKWLGSGIAGITAAKTGLLGFLKGGGKKSVIAPATQHLNKIVDGVDGMPAWFKPLVNKVIKQGDDVTKTHSTLDRQIVHKTKLPDSKTDVVVTQDLATGDVVVDIGAGKHGFGAGHHGQPVRLEYKAGEWIEPTVRKGETPSKGIKTKEEFWVEEAEFTGGHPENVKFEETVSSKFGEHGSNFDEVEKFAIGTVKKIKKASGGRASLSAGGPIDINALIQLYMAEGMSEAEAIAAANKPLPFHILTDKAEGGRVPMFLGGGLLAGKEFIRQLIKKLAKDKGETGSYLMKVMNPKAYKKLIDDPKIVHKWDPDSGLLSIDRARKLMKSTKTERANQLERYLDMAKSSMESDKNIQSMIDAGIKSGMSRESAEKLATGLRKAIDVEDVIPRNVTDETILDLEQMVKNLKTKDRKLNATGGLAGMLGE